MFSFVCECAYANGCVPAVHENWSDKYASCHSYDTDDGYCFFFIVCSIRLFRLLHHTKSIAHSDLFHFILGVFPFFFWTDSHIAAWTIWLWINHASHIQNEDEGEKKERKNPWASILMLFCIVGHNWWTDRVEIILM